MLQKTEEYPKEKYIIICCKISQCQIGTGCFLIVVRAAHDKVYPCGHPVIHALQAGVLRTIRYRVCRITVFHWPAVCAVSYTHLGQRGQTVNLLATPSKVRILLHPLADLILRTGRRRLLSSQMLTKGIGEYRIGAIIR